MNLGCNNVNTVLDDYAGISIEICQELVKRPSEDPSGDTRSVAAFINDFFCKNNISSQIISPHPEKPNVVAIIEGKRAGKHLIFNGHIDTFPVGNISNWTKDPFGGNIVDGKLYGRGAADMKGGVAASMAAAVILNQLKDTFPGKISFTCVSDEEVGGEWGTRYLLKNYPELYGDALINGEPSSVEHIRIGEKGKYKVRIITQTNGGHGAYAGLKANAIVKMIEILNSLLEFENEAPEMDSDIKRLMEQCRNSYDRILGVGAMEAALSSRMNIGTINGGIMVNMIPDKCEAELNFRLPPGITVKFINSWLSEKIGKFKDTSYDIYFSADSYLTRPEHPLVQIAKRTANKFYGHPVFANYSIGGTESYLWRSHGIPGITYGPNHHNMGSPDEYIFVDELPLVTKVHALTAWEFLNNFSNHNN